MWKRKVNFEKDIEYHFIDGKSVKYLRKEIYDEGIPELEANTMLLNLYMKCNIKRLKKSRKDRNFGLILLFIYLGLVTYKYFDTHVFDPIMGRLVILLIACIPFLRSWIRVKIEEPKFDALKETL